MPLQLSHLIHSPPPPLLLFYWVVLLLHLSFAHSMPFLSLSFFSLSSFLVFAYIDCYPVLRSLLTHLLSRMHQFLLLRKSAKMNWFCCSSRCSERRVVNANREHSPLSVAHLHLSAKPFKFTVRYSLPLTLMCSLLSSPPPSLSGRTEMKLTQCIWNTLAAALSSLSS